VLCARTRIFIIIMLTAVKTSSRIQCLCYSFNARNQVSDRTKLSLFLTLLRQNVRVRKEAVWRDAACSCVGGCVCARLILPAISYYLHRLRAKRAVRNYSPAVRPSRECVRWMVGNFGVISSCQVGMAYPDTVDACFRIEFSKRI
jgi:hypothetical protein